MRHYQDGDAKAFDALYQRHRQPLFAYLYRHTGQSQSVAEDLFQDIWINLIKASDRYTEKASFKTWLYTIAHHRVIDFYRKQARYGTDQPFDGEDESNRIDETPLSLPDDQVQQMETLARFSAALATLPTEQQAVVLLKQEGFSLQEMAGVTNSEKETVKSRLRYAIKKLRHALRDLQSDS